jgi:YD repeat-containing protein
VASEVYAAAADAAPVKSVTYSYNEAGSLVGYDDTVTSATYAYDDLQRLIGETVDYGSFSLTNGYGYYGNGWKEQYTDPAGRIKTYSYDKAGKPLGVDLGLAGQVSYNSYSWNRPSRITLPGGATLNFNYNGLQQVTAINGKDPAENPIIDYEYSYSPVGNIIEKSTEHGAYSYGYDSLYRLIDVKGPVEDESYEYDSLANRISSADFTDWNYNGNNQLTSYGPTTFKYDNHGNMAEKTISGQNGEFTYSVDNRLVKITDDTGAVVATYYYDPYGRRLWKEVAGVRTYFHYNDEGLAGEYDATGNEQRTYGYQPGSPWSTNPLFVQIEGIYYPYNAT